jgi:hypothetical protein
VGIGVGIGVGTGVGAGVGVGVGVGVGTVVAGHVIVVFSVLVYTGVIVVFPVALSVFKFTTVIPKPALQLAGPPPDEPGTVNSVVVGTCLPGTERLPDSFVMTGVPL